MGTRLNADDLAPAHLSQADLDEYDTYVTEHGDPLRPMKEPTERNTTMLAKYAIDQNYKQFDEATGLPAYPKSTGAMEVKLRTVQAQLTTTQNRVEAALDRALDQFEVALEAEDRKRSTQERLADMTRRTRRIN